MCSNPNLPKRPDSWLIIVAQTFSFFRNISNKKYEIQWSSLVRCDATHRSSQLLSRVHGKPHTYCVLLFTYLLFVLRPKQENPVCRLLDNGRIRPFLLSLLYLFFTCLSHLLNRLGAFPDQPLIYIAWSSVKY